MYPGRAISVGGDDLCNPIGTNMNINLNPTISPLQQGDLDSLCGIYAIINAIRLAAGTTITKPTEMNLSYRGVRVLLEREVLGATLQNGLRAKNFKRLSKEIVKKARQLTGLNFRTNRFDEAHKTPEDFFKDELLAGRPTCLRITGSIDHYTVLSGITPTKLILFDSDRMW